MDLTIVGDDRHRQHDPPFELDQGRRIEPVWDRPARLEAIRAALATAGFPVVPPRRVDDAVLHTVHDERMVTFLREGHAAWRAAGGPEVMIPDTFRAPRPGRAARPNRSPLGAAGWWCTDTATPIVAGSYTASRAAVDIAVTGADLLTEGSAAVYALTRPPGHHAGRDHYGGFCLFNHAAIAAHRLRDAGRVAVLDLDVHHGNGTQDIFWRDAQVLYVSLHGHPDHLYPYFSGTEDEVGEGPGRATTRNLPLAAGTDDASYLEVLHTACEVVTDFRPATLVVSLGWDTAASDPIGSLALSGGAYAAIGGLLAQLDLPTLLVQEGGYAVDDLGGFALDLLGGLRGER